jgi:HEAT repeat protein
MSSLRNPAVLIWISIFLSAVNIGLSMSYLFFWGGTITPAIVLLTLSQLAVFFQLHIQIHDLRGAANYAYASAPLWSDWIKFIAGHTLRAADLPDAIGAYSLSPDSIRHQSLFSGFALLGMYLMVGGLILGIIFNLINIRFDIFSGESTKRRNREIKRWIRRAAAFLSVGMILVFGWKHDWTVKNWLLCFFGNALLTLDFGDAVQIFNWQSPLVTAYLPENGGPPAVLSLLFRLMTGIYAVVLLNRFYLRILKTHDRKAVEDLMMIWTSHEYPTRERVLAVKKLEQFSYLSDFTMPYLVKSLSETNKAVRNEVAEALKKMDAEWMKSEVVKKEISHLLNLLEKEDKSIRTAAVEALGEIGAGAVKAVPDLINLLKKNDMTASVAQTLGKIGQAAIPELIKVLTHDNDEVRESVVQVLEKIDPRWFQNDAARREIGFFIKHLSDDSLTARISAVRVLGEFGSAAEAAVPMLVRLLADRDARKTAVKSLGKIGNGATAAIAPLIVMLADSDEELRSSAVKALDKIAPNWRQSESALNAVPEFMKAVGSKEASAYESPEEALCLIGSAAIHKLTEALAEKNKDIVSIAAKTLKKINPEWFRDKNAALAVPRLATALSDSEWYVRAAAAQVLGKIGPAAMKAVPNLVKTLADTNKNVREAAKKALEMVTVKHTESEEDNTETETEKDNSERNCSRWSEDEAMNAEIARLADSKTEVQDAAAAALEKMNPQWRKSEAVRHAVPDFVKSLGEGVGTAFDAPRKALLKIGVPAIFHLVKSLAEGNKTVSAAAVQILEQMDPQWHQTPGAREAVPYLEKALSDSEWYVRDAAAQVLGKIGPAAIKTVPSLVKTMADTNKTVRASAKEALDKIVLK